MLSLDQDDIFEPLDDLAYAVVIIALLISGFSFIAAWIFSRTISNPVELAAEQLKHIRSRDFSTEFPDNLLQRDDEIGTFIKSVDSMSEIIREEIEKNRQKDAVLTYQSRLAKTGEMIAHIAHQWRQPLNNLNLIISNTRESKDFEKIADEESVRSLQKCSRIIAEMSQTIDDFRYFLHPKSTDDYFSIESSVNFVIELMEDSLKQNRIRIETDFAELPQAYGAAHALTQVISNIMYNARDALSEKKSDNRLISISIFSGGKQSVIEIFNNGPLLKEDVISQLFRPYFTTKSDSKGTGIGLYMSKQIIEKHFNGTIALENISGGVLCRMEISNERTL